jgi:putative Holliday junction resolvase
MAKAVKGTSGAARLHARSGRDLWPLHPLRVKAPFAARPWSRYSPRSMKRRRTCALDLGGARVGVAIDDELGVLAHPRGHFDGKDQKRLVESLKAFVAEENVGRIIVGLPLDMKGGEGEAARKARYLAQTIANATGCEIELWDERLTTVQARRSLQASEVPGRKQRSRIDEASACVILQAWLDGQGGRRGGR